MPNGVIWALVALCPVTASAQEAQPGTAPAILAPQDIPYPGVLKLSIDASDVDRAIIRGHLTLPVVRSGPMVLYYPRWVPGHHAPSAPISRLAGLVIRAKGAIVPWKRDPVTMNAFHLSVPEGVKALDIEFQYLSPTDPKMGRIEITPGMIDLQWTALALYPAGYYSRQIKVQASVKLPAGWRWATALEQESVENDTIQFKPVPYDTLVDSPIVAGRHYRQYVLDASVSAPVRLNLFADSPEQLEASPPQIEAHRALITQSYKLFGSRHFDHYDFLVGLTARIGSLGAEHHRSSENFTVANYFTGWDASAPSRELLPHEFVHSWNGKFRRGADLLTPTLDVPMQNSLLWVYEGLTRYLGAVLAVRSGLNSKQQGLDNFALSAATMEYRRGRNWRPLLDTTNHSIYAEGRQPWPNWQRGSDYYLEGQLLWLDVDTRIRELSAGKRSLDDFVRVFFGVNDGSYTPVPYTFDTVLAALNTVQPYDWGTFFRTHVEDVAASAPLDGLRRGGYQLTYSGTPTPFFENGEAQSRVTDLTYSIGLVVDGGGVLTDVLWDGPAFAAGLTIGAQIVSVNGTSYDPNGLKGAINACKGSAQPLQLLVKRSDSYKSVTIPCGEGLRYPRLERLGGVPARLDDILKPRD